MFMSESLFFLPARKPLFVRRYSRKKGEYLSSLSRIEWIPTRETLARRAKPSPETSSRLQNKSAFFFAAVFFQPGSFSNAALSMPNTDWNSASDR